MKATQAELAAEKQMRKESEDKLLRAKAFIKSFLAAHPDWKPPADVLLMSEDIKEGKHLFDVSALALSISLALATVNNLFAIAYTHTHSIPHSLHVLSLTFIISVCENTYKL